MMNKSNKYKVLYKYRFENRLLTFYIKKLNLAFHIKCNKNSIVVMNNQFIPLYRTYDVINNFFIHPTTIQLLKSSDELNKVLSKELIMKEFNERTRKNSISCTEGMGTE